MSKVGVVFKVYPNDGELDKAMASIKKLSPNSMQTEDVAFGLKLIKVFFVFDNAETNSSVIEEKIKSSEGVSEVEVQEESLM